MALRPDHDRRQTCVSSVEEPELRNPELNTFSCRNLGAIKYIETKHAQTIKERDTTEKDSTP